MKVKIKKLPKKAYGGQQSTGALDVTPATWGDTDYRKAKEGLEVKQTLTKIPRSMANLEAEDGESAFGPISGDTIPDHFNIKGSKHSSGGVPLNLPDDTFIFSDTKAMRITDPAVLKMFNKIPKKGGYTPAELAKPYDINKYKAILMDPESDRRSRETATLMIKNFIIKLGALALAQESKKGFPQGIPEMARPYMEANKITDEDLIPKEQITQQAHMMKNGGINKFKPGGAVDTDPKILIEDINRITIDGSLGANKANILKDGKPITGTASGVTVTSVEAIGDKIIINAKMGLMSGQRPLGHFKKDSKGNYKFIPNKSIYDKFMHPKKGADKEDQRLFNSFIEGVETNSSFRDDVRGAIKGTNKYEAKTKTKEYFTPVKSTKPTATTTTATTTTSNIPVKEEEVEIETNNQGTDLPTYEEILKQNPPKVGQSKDGWWSNVTGATPPYLPTNKVWDGEKWVKGTPTVDQSTTTQGTTTQSANTGMKLEDLPSYQNASPEQKAMFKSLNPEQKQMLLDMYTKQAGSSNRIPMQGSTQLGYDRFGMPYDAISRQQFGNYYGERPFYNMNNAGAYNLDFSNPFSKRAFRRAGNWLSPMGPGRMTGPGYGTGIPATGFPMGMIPTSVDTNYRKNPWLKALFNKDIARKEFRTRYNFNEPSLLRPSSLSRFTDDIDIEEEMSNRDFARKHVPGRDRYSRKDRNALRKRLNKGLITQEEYLNLLEEEEGIENDTIINDYEYAQMLRDDEARDAEEFDYEIPEINEKASESMPFTPVDEVKVKVDEVDGWDLEGVNRAHIQPKESETYGDYYRRQGYNEQEVKDMLGDRRDDQIMSGEYRKYIKDIQNPYFEDLKSKFSDTEDDTDPNAEAKAALGPDATEEDIADYNETKRIEVLQNQENVTEETQNYSGYTPRYPIGTDKYYGNQKGKPGQKHDPRYYMLDNPITEEQQEILNRPSKQTINLDDPEARWMLQNMYEDDATQDDVIKRVQRMRQSGFDIANNERGDIDKMWANDNLSYDLDYGNKLSNLLTSFQQDPPVRKAFGGENQTLNMFVYGGYNKYPHGGFHTPFEERMKETRTQDSLLPSAEGILGASDAQSGIFTKDNPYINPLTGKRSSFMTDSETGKYTMVDQPPSSFETKQKVNTAFDWNPEDTDQQLGWVANKITNTGRAIQDARREGEMNNLGFVAAQDANVSQRLNKGHEYALNQGVAAIDAYSPANLMRTMGTTLGEYGGSIPIARYGTDMGGAYYPVMSSGGGSRVRIMSLPSKDGGGPAGHSHPHQSWQEGQTYSGGSKEWDDWYTSESAKDYRTNRYDAYKQRRTDVNKDILDEENYHNIYRRGQKQINAMQDFYKDDAGYFDSKDWDSNYAYKADGTKDMSVNKGKNWKYKASIKQMNDKIRKDNPNMAQAEIDKLLYTALSGEDISNFQSGYIGGKFMDASGGKTGSALQDFIHTGMSDQTVMIDGVPINISPEDQRFGNTTVGQREATTIPITADEIVENNDGKVTVEENKSVTTDMKDCICYPLDAQGKPDKTKTPISTTQIPVDEKCDCNATIHTQRKQQFVDDPYEKLGYSRQDYRNLNTAQRYETEAAKVNPFLVNYQEQSPTLTNPYTADITSALQGIRSSVDMQGGPASAKFAKQMAAMSNTLPQTGKRYSDKAALNARDVNTFSNLNAQGQFNAGRINSANIQNFRALNAAADNTSLKARNAKMSNINLAEQAAHKRMIDKSVNNYMNPNNQISYSDDTPWYRKTYRDFSLTKPALTKREQYEQDKKNYGQQAALAMMNKKSKYGGSVKSNSFIPTYTTMPYGN